MGITRFSRQSLFAAVAALSLAMLGCGDHDPPARNDDEQLDGNGGDDGNADSGGDGNPDASGDASADGGDASLDGSGGDGGVTPTECLVRAELGDLGAMTVVAATKNPQAEPDQAKSFYSLLAAADGEPGKIDLLEVTLWEGYSVFTDVAIGPGTYQLTGADADPSLCGICVFLYADLTESGEFEPLQSFIATAGTVQIDSVDGTLTGSVAGLQFTLLGENGPDAASTCTSSIAAGTFTAPITVPRR